MLKGTNYGETFQVTTVNSEDIWLTEFPREKMGVYQQVSGHSCAGSYFFISKTGDYSIHILSLNKRFHQDSEERQ